MGELPLPVELGDIVVVDAVLLKVHGCPGFAECAVSVAYAPYKFVNSGRRLRLLRPHKEDDRWMRGLDEKVIPGCPGKEVSVRAGTLERNPGAGLSQMASGAKTASVLSQSARVTESE